MTRRTCRALAEALPRPERSRVRRCAVAVCSSALVLAFVLSGGLGTVRSTLSSWTDEESASGSFSAATIPAPILTQDCQFRPSVLGLGARVRIFWELPEGYALEDLVVQASTSGLGSVLAPLTGFNLQANTETQDDGTYQTDVPTNLLGGLLGLGSELEIAFAVEHDSGWRSENASVASNAGLLAGIGGNCRNLT